LNNDPEKTIVTNVVGVTFEGRQSILESIYPNTELSLVREPDNPYDKNAVAVYCSWSQVGYLGRKLAKNVGPAMDRMKIDKLSALAVQVTGIPGNTRGLKISFKLPAGAIKPAKPAWLLGLFWGFCLACGGASATMRKATLFPSISAYLNQLVFGFITNFIFYSLFATLIVWLFRKKPGVALTIVGIAFSLALVFSISSNGQISSNKSQGNTVNFSATTNAARDLYKTAIVTAPTLTPRPTTPQCLTWAEVGLDDVGKQICVYGTVLTTYVTRVFGDDHIIISNGGQETTNQAFKVRRRHCH
jgi:hypothetical protein